MASHSVLLRSSRLPLSRLLSPLLSQQPQRSAIINRPTNLAVAVAVATTTTPARYLSTDGPPFEIRCLRCHGIGHKAEDCRQLSVCARCGQPGHYARNCPKPKTCDRCGDEGHLARNVSIFLPRPLSKKEVLASRSSLPGFWTDLVLVRTDGCRKVSPGFPDVGEVLCVWQDGSYGERMPLGRETEMLLLW